MKRILSFLLAAVMIISCLSVNAFAKSEKENDPIILISGFMCSQLYLNFGKENEEKIWGPSADIIFDRVKGDFPNLAKSLAGLIKGNKEKFGETLGEGAKAVLGKLTCNPDGSSVYPVSHYPNNPATSNLEYMLGDEEIREYMYEKPFCEYLAGETDPSRVFMFQYDSRLDAITNADCLRKFIKEVKAYTNSDKVSIFALSFGGLITSTYLTYYSQENDIGKAVLSVPALGGTDLPYRILKGKIDLALEDLVEFLETAVGGESNFARIFEYTERLDGLNEIAAAACTGGVSDVVKYWGSLWSLCSTEYYEELKAEFLDAAENKSLIERTDKVHYEVMANLTETFAACKEKGIDISILCGTGSSLCLGGENNGDVILPAKGVSGAVCAPLGKRFVHGYSGVKTTCRDSSHNHISPSMQIDASGAYLPENTWFIEGQFHGQYYYEEYTRSLVTKLLLTDDIRDIYSDPDYPQFESSNHSYRTVHAGFDKSLSGYISNDDKTLTITNVSETNDIKLLSVIAYGADVRFDISGTGIVSDGETVSIPFEGDFDKSPVQLTVNYFEIGSLTPFSSCKFVFTVNGGEIKPCADMFADSEYQSIFRNEAPEWLYNLLEKLSIKRGIECIYDSVIYFVK